MSSQKETADAGEANIYYSNDSSSSSEDVLSYLALMERYENENIKNDNNSSRSEPPEPEIVNLKERVTGVFGTGRRFFAIPMSWVRATEESSSEEFTTQCEPPQLENVDPKESVTGVLGTCRRFCVRIIASCKVKLFNYLFV